ncbi:MAG TPA: integrase arm-type DNA-binding domain-containing protein [Pseudomonadales bacterium]|nr:integrase arm-type DNA-binding domain-containing protein [Pseudomonadales bacterium]
MAGSDKLTEVAVRNAKAKEKPYKLSDGGGLYLEVMPNGSRYWRLKYRYAGKENRLALGVYPDVSLKTARRKKTEAKQLLDNGADPGNHRRQNRLAAKAASNNSFGSIAEEWLEKQQKTWSVSHTTRTRWLLGNHLLPWLAKRPISEVTTPELLSVLRRIEQKGIVETAHRAKQTCGQIFRYAIATGRADRDPTHDLKGALASPKEKHLASITDPKEVGKLLVTMDSYRGTPEVKAALLLSPLLFQRPGEIRTMKWADINFESAEWRYTVSKTNTPHIVPLSRQAIAILSELQPITGSGLYVFPSARGHSRPLSENGVRTALRTLGFSNDQITPHGFRAMARTILDEVLGYRVDWIEHQLAHAVKDPNGRAYNRTAHLEGRRQMMQGWADYLDQLREASRN